MEVVVVGLPCVREPSVGVCVCGNGATKPQRVAVALRRCNAVAVTGTPVPYAYVVV